LDILALREMDLPFFVANFVGVKAVKAVPRGLRLRPMDVHTSQTQRLPKSPGMCRLCGKALDKVSDKGDALVASQNFQIQEGHPCRPAF
jgi:hypothetical protein